MSAANDIKRGKDALVYFHNASLEYPAYGSRPIAQLYAELQAANPSFLEGFGFALATADFKESRVEDAMEELAAASKGQIPKASGFFNALQGQVGKLDFLDTIKVVSADTASQLGDGLAQVGDTAVDVLKEAKGYVVYLPLLAFAGLAFYIWNKGKHA